MQKTSSNDIVFGIHAVKETLSSDQEIEKIFLQKGLRSAQAKEISAEARRHNIPISLVPVEKLNRITRKNHQGVICYVSPIQYASLDNILESCFSSGKEPFFLVLDQITDVRNFGAIARTAECAGIDAIIIPNKGAAQVNSDAMKTSAGALNHIPICRTSHLKESVQFLKESGIAIVACTEKGNASIYDAQLSGPLAIVLGSEESGISNEIRALADQEAKIPLQGTIGSLNVSVATAIITFEALRQRIEA